jgi:ParB family chromosome partitioning protein
MSADQSKRLGRGLSALLGESAATVAAQAQRGQRTIPVGDIAPGRFQPRKDFAPEALQELAASIRAQGVLQPIVVRKSAGGTPFELVAGERRWRAAQLAQLHEIPAIVRELSDDEALEIGLVENLQRQDLGPIEEAQAYRRLIDELGHTQEEVAKALGKSRSHIANQVRLLELPQAVVDLVAAGKLSVGHAKLLVAQPDPQRLADIVVAKELTVRETAQLIERGKAMAHPRAARAASGSRNARNRMNWSRRPSTHGCTNVPDTSTNSSTSVICCACPTTVTLHPVRRSGSNSSASNATTRLWTAAASLAPPATRITTSSRHSRKFTGCTAGRASSVKTRRPTRTACNRSRHCRWLRTSSPCRFDIVINLLAPGRESPPGWSANCSINTLCAVYQRCGRAIGPENRGPSDPADITRTVSRGRVRIRIGNDGH